MIVSYTVPYLLVIISVPLLVNSLSSPHREAGNSRAEERRGPLSTESRLRSDNGGNEPEAAGEGGSKWIKLDDPIEDILKTFASSQVDIGSQSINDWAMMLVKGILANQALAKVQPDNWSSPYKDVRDPVYKSLMTNGNSLIFGHDDYEMVLDRLKYVFESFQSEGKNRPSFIAFPLLKSRMKTSNNLLGIVDRRRSLGKDALPVSEYRSHFRKKSTTGSFSMHGSKMSRFCIDLQRTKQNAADVYFFPKRDAPLAVKLLDKYLKVDAFHSMSHPAQQLESVLFVRLNGLHFSMIMQLVPASPKEVPSTLKATPVQSELEAVSHIIFDDWLRQQEIPLVSAPDVKRKAIVLASRSPLNIELDIAQIGITEHPKLIQALVIPFFNPNVPVQLKREATSRLMAPIATTGIGFSKDFKHYVLLAKDASSLSTEVSGESSNRNGLGSVIDSMKDLSGATITRDWSEHLWDLGFLNMKKLLAEAFKSKIKHLYVVRLDDKTVGLAIRLGPYDEPGEESGEDGDTDRGSDEESELIKDAMWPLQWN